jgi:hypothetical protein
MADPYQMVAPITERQNANTYTRAQFDPYVPGPAGG